jgi:hypothetical protein
LEIANGRTTENDGFFFKIALLENPAPLAIWKISLIVVLEEPASLVL